MINKDRIVPIKLIDLLTLYGTILKIQGVTAEILKADDIEGDYTAAANDKTYICDQPVKSFDFGTATAGTVYFVADEATFEGFKIDGVAAETANDAIPADGVSLCRAQYGTGEIRITVYAPQAE